MPSITAYNKPNCFSRSNRHSTVTGLNNAWRKYNDNALALDIETRTSLNEEDGADRNHGICCGIVCSWMVAYLNGDSGASNEREFEGHFVNMLRPQGAYMKAEHITKPNAVIKKMATTANFDVGIEEIREKVSTKMSISQIPAGRWAAYSSVWGHAIGMAGGDGFHIMDPNYGLYSYDSANSFVSDFNQIVEARRASKKKKASATITNRYFKKR